MTHRSSFSPNRVALVVIGIPIGVVVFSVWGREAISRHRLCATWRNTADKTLVAAAAAAGSDDNQAAGEEALISLSRHFDWDEESAANDTPSLEARDGFVAAVDEIMYGAAGSTHHEDPARVAGGILQLRKSVELFAATCHE